MTCNIRVRHLCLFSKLSVWMLVFSCAGSGLKLDDWQKLPRAQYTIPPYAHYLQNYKIALDPGHGGNAALQGYKRGPSGKREAEMNLNVAFMLREFLVAAGVQVYLTREDDRFVSLRDRVERADSAGCDFLISLHHNASRNPETNYSAVFYHLSPDYSPLSIDLARNIYFGLVEALRLPQVLEDGLLADRIMYPAGFGLLRHAAMPAILLESSFYSNRQEEKRLTDRKYNRREAYGIFLGLARWAAGGVPEAVPVSSSLFSRTKQPELVYRLSDGLRQRIARQIDEQLLYTQSVSASIDGQSCAVTLSADKTLLYFQPDSTLGNGLHLVEVDVQNMFKNHNFPRTDTLVIASPVDSIRIIPVLTSLPADTSAMMPVTLYVYDADGEPVWDGTPVRIHVDQGSVAPARPSLAGGIGTVYYRASDAVGPARLTVGADDLIDSLDIELEPPGSTWLLSGVTFDDSTQMPIAGTKVTLDDSISVFSDTSGVFFIQNPPVGISQLSAVRAGYGSRTFTVYVDSMVSNLIPFGMPAHLAGLLHNSVVILDAALDDSISGDLFPGGLSAAQANYLLATYLADTLTQAGTVVKMIRDGARGATIKERILAVNEIKDGWYLKIAYFLADTDSTFVTTTIYPANKMGEQIAKALLDIYHDLPATRGVLLQNMQVPEVTYTNKTAIELAIRCRRPDPARDAQSVFAGILNFYKQTAKTNPQ